MFKKIVSIIITLLIYFLFSTSNKTYAAISVSTYPTDINPGDTVMIDFNGFPSPTDTQTQVTYCMYVFKGTKADTRATISLNILKNGNNLRCVATPDGSTWQIPNTNIPCALGTDTNVRTFLNTNGLIISGRPVSDNYGTFGLEVGYGPGCGTLVATGSIYVQPPPSQATFNISSMSPNPAKPGDNLTATLTGVTVMGNYKYGFDADNLTSSTNCSSSSCNLPGIRIPTTVNSAIDLIVQDPQGNQKTASLTIGLATFTPPRNASPTPWVTRPPLPTTLNGCIATITTSGEQVATFACIWVYLKNAIDALLSFAGIVAIFVIVYSGVRFITSRGDPETIETSKKTLTYAIIGLILIVSAFLLIYILGQLLGINPSQILSQPPV